MYAGHLGLGLIAKGRRPDIPVAVFLGGSVATDLLVLSVFHTLPLVLATATVAYLVGRNRFDSQVGFLLTALVGAHFTVDLVTSSLALWPNGPEAGLRLYDTPAADFVLELAVISLGWSFWRQSLPEPTHRRVTSMLVLLVISQGLFELFVAAGANG